MGVFGAILDLLFPPKCVFCRKILPSARVSVCEKCHAELPYTCGREKTGDFFAHCYAPLYYEGSVRESLLRFKFHDATGYAKTYGELIARCIKENLSDSYDLISWVPLSKRRFRERGYDQAMLIAMAAALELGSVAVSTLEKHIHVEKQSTMGSKEKRKANISGAYRVADPEIVAGKRILLIDDIVTTGSTFSECAKCLLNAGAAAVVCAAVAQTRD